MDQPDSRHSQPLGVQCHRGESHLDRQALPPGTVLSFQGGREQPASERARGRCAAYASLREAAATLLEVFLKPQLLARGPGRPGLP